MKLFKFIVLTLIGLLILTTSCNNSKSYADRLKDEKRAIDLFIAKNNLEIIKDFPEDGKFEPHEFYKDVNSGVYFNIMEPGDSTQIALGQEVYIRFKEVIYLIEDDSVLYNKSEYFTEKFVGPISSYTRDVYTIPGWIVPLTYNVGHKGKVKMIVPFNMGTAYDRSTGFQPTFYDDLEYRFEGEW